MESINADSPVTGAVSLWPNSSSCRVVSSSEYSEQKVASGASNLAALLPIPCASMASRVPPLPVAPGLPPAPATLTPWLVLGEAEELISRLDDHDQRARRKEGLKAKVNRSLKRTNIIHKRGYIYFYPWGLVRFCRQLTLKDLLDSFRKYPL